MKKIVAFLITAMTFVIIAVGCEMKDPSPTRLSFEVNEGIREGVVVGAPEVLLEGTNVAFIKIKFKNSRDDIYCSAIISLTDNISEGDNVFIYSVEFNSDDFSSWARSTRIAVKKR